MFESWKRGLFTDAGGGTAGGGTGTGDGSQGGEGGQGTETGQGTGQGDGGQQPARTFTQEELDRIIAERLAREREKYKDYNELKKAAEELKKIKGAQMSETEKLQAKLAEQERKILDYERELAEARLEATKLRVLDELGLPKTWANRVFGTDEEEIRQDAEELKKLLGQGKPGAVGSGSNPGPGTPPDLVEQARKLAEERNKGTQQPTGGYDPWARK